MELNRDQLDALYELRVVSSDGRTLGPVGHIYLDDQTHQATWITAKSGLFGLREVFIPIAGAQIEPEAIVVQYRKSVIMDSPRVECNGHLSQEQQEELLEYFGESSERLDHAMTTQTEPAPGEPPVPPPGEPPLPEPGEPPVPGPGEPPLPEPGEPPGPGPEPGPAPEPGPVQREVDLEPVGADHTSVVAAEEPGSDAASEDVDEVPEAPARPGLAAVATAPATAPGQDSAEHDAEESEDAPQEGRTARQAKSAPPPGPESKAS